MTTTELCISGSIEKFLGWLSVNGNSHNTVKAYQGDLRGLQQTLPSDTMDWRVLEVAAATYLTANRATWAPKTTERKLGAFRGWGRSFGCSDFLASYRPPKPARAIPHPLPEGIDGVLRMMRACTTPAGRITPPVRRKRALVALTGLCGLRVGEALSVKPEHVDRLEQTVTVRGKGDRTRTVPISDLAWTTVTDAIAVTPAGETIVGLKDRHARSLITELGVKAGLRRHVSSHDMRATLATAAYDKSMNLRVVQEILGHASPDQTVRYTGVAAGAMRDAVNVA